MAKYVFGIDLGTTYSCIAYVDGTGRATVAGNAEGTNTTPSVVNFASPSEVVVGQVAKENAVIDPDNTVSLVKRLMGRSDFAISYNGEDKSPEEVSAYILRKVAGDAGRQIGAQVRDVVITCPAYFGTAERVATKNAGIIAGLNVLEVISEPTAAALYYGCAKEQGEKTVLVFDLGGGTFDVTVMNISSEKIEVVCSDGNHDLGGKDWDEAVMQYLAEEFMEQTGSDGEFDEYAQQDIRLKAEKAKQQLSARTEVPVLLDVAGLRAKVLLSREKFDEITSVLLGEAMEKTDAAIAVAEKKGYHVDEILLVGGSTRMPQVTKALADRYGIEPKILEPDEAVAKGAAIHAVNVYINNQKSLEPGVRGESAGAAKGLDPDDYREELAVQPEKMSIGGRHRKVVVATTKSFAVKVVQNGRDVCRNLIVKNQPMPEGSITGAGTFYTLHDNQDSVLIRVYESDFMDTVFEVDEYFFLGEAVLELPGDMPAGAPIEIIFLLNSEGILDVTGIDRTAKGEVHVSMRTKGVMAAEKVDDLKKRSKSIAVV